ncbi:glycosyltransferase family 2 protein [Patescibacteria group bacterium]|nr:glycosyltransferase family 2 protein [Patescibacteria group bacterium]
MKLKIPKVSVSIVSYNSQKYLAGCLQSVLQQSHQSVEIILVDNASHQNPATEIKKNFPDSDIRLIRNAKNLGYSGGHNVGIAQATGQYVLCLNPDVILAKDYLKNIVCALSQNNKIGAAQGKILKCRLENQLEKTDKIDSLGTKILPNHQYVELGGEGAGEKHHLTVEVFGVSGAAPVFRRTALENIKNGAQYFDENFQSYKEDIDISWRLRHAGWQCWLIPTAIAWHDRWETGSTEHDRQEEVVQRRRQKADQINYLSYRNHFLVNLKNEFLVNFVIYSLPIIWYEIKKMFYLLLFERRTLRGLKDFIKLLPLTLQQRHDILRGSKIKPSVVRRWF